MNQNKRGVSPIVATVLIIMITVTAGVLVARFLLPFVKTNLEKGSECVDYRDYFKFEDVASDYNCYSTSTDGSVNEYKISVKSVGGNLKAEEISEIAGFDLIFYGSEGTSKRVKVRIDGRSDSGVTMLSGTEVKIPKPGEWMAYKYTTGEEFNKVEVYPALKSGRTCDVPDSISLAFEC